MADNFNLQRFLTVQDPVLDTVMQELEHGRKQGHWMWYIFPQITGLGRSTVSEQYAIRSLDEASAYRQHASLGKRLVNCTRVVNRHQNLSAEQIFGHPDYLKFRSCMTLFDRVAERDNPFKTALAQFFEAQPDPRTLAILDKMKL